MKLFWWLCAHYLPSNVGTLWHSCIYVYSHRHTQSDAQAIQPQIHESFGDTERNHKSILQSGILRRRSYRAPNGRCVYYDTWHNILYGIYLPLGGLAMLASGVCVFAYMWTHIFGGWGVVVKRGGKEQTNMFTDIRLEVRFAWLCVFVCV